MLPTYYINLDARHDRRDFMEQQFAQLRIDAERIPAVPATDIPAYAAGRYWRASEAPLTPGEFACGLSHLEAMRRIVASGEAAGFVLEDDGVLAPALPEFLELLEDGLPAGVDAIKLETYNSGQVRLSSRNPVTLGGYEMRRLMSTHFGSCGYAVTRKMALEVLADQTFSKLAADIYLFGRAGTLLFRRQIYQLVPALVIQLQYRGSPDRPEAKGAIRHSRPAYIGRTPRKRALRLAENLRSAAMDAFYFGYDAAALVGRRYDVPFASEGYSRVATSRSASAS